MASCVYCNSRGTRWTIETAGLYAPVILCREHGKPLRELAEAFERDARADASGERPSVPDSTLGLDVIEDPDEMIRRLESEQ